MTRRWLDEFAAGERLQIPGRYEMTPERVRAYAEAYDPQTIHLDAEAAATEFFGGLVASGWHSLGATARLMVEARPLGDTPLIGVGIDALRFLAPVWPGDVLQVEAEVLEVRPSASQPERGFIRLRIVTHNQRDEAVLTQDWTLLLPRRPAPVRVGPEPGTRLTPPQSPDRSRRNRPTEAAAIARPTTPTSLGFLAVRDRTR